MYCTVYCYYNLPVNIFCEICEISTLHFSANAMPASSQTNFKPNLAAHSLQFQVRSQVKAPKDQYIKVKHSKLLLNR